MTPTEQLKEEHQGITLMLKILERVCAKMETKGKVDPAHLERIVEFFKVFADKCHHGKEEDLLFPEMESGYPEGERTHWGHAYGAYPGPGLCAGDGRSGHPV